ncbi:hypothetical protein GYMLUDRAFT_601321 [Collybiopsis luxurians FD-317 M1]|uniref:Uncharacterized protein n=1 Tax=Collybiopsis luxurians FD-317 M1 TaxID=944289 RepID=A0A0D0B9G9_9AGAR|nr:hypothetical protein GYMLUDRAFT_601321 [Collybiopsis luxurians FD-317 M1]
MTFLFLFSIFFFCSPFQVSWLMSIMRGFNFPHGFYFFLLGAFTSICISSVHTFFLCIYTCFIVYRCSYMLNLLRRTNPCASSFPSRFWIPAHRFLSYYSSRCIPFLFLSTPPPHTLSSIWARHSLGRPTCTSLPFLANSIVRLVSLPGYLALIS